MHVIPYGMCVLVTMATTGASALVFMPVGLVIVFSLYYRSSPDVTEAF